jgi:hypothetical protein
MAEEHNKSWPKKVLQKWSTPCFGNLSKTIATA